MNNTKKFFSKYLKILLLLFIILFSFVTISFAHPGRTDSNGGHYDSSNGDYHYHHGYSAHYHTDGVCPYDFDDRTYHLTNTQNYNTYTTTKKKTTKNVEQNIITESKKNNHDYTNTLTLAAIFGGGIALSLISNSIIFIKEQLQKEKLALPEVKIQTSEIKPQTIQRKSNCKNKCPRCNGRLILRNGKYGKFYGCSNYPKCRFTKDYINTIKK